MHRFLLVIAILFLVAGCVFFVIWIAGKPEPAKSREVASPAVTKARLGNRLFYEVKIESIAVYGFDMPDWDAVDKLLQMKSKEDPDLTNIRVLLMRGDVPSIRKELEHALGVSWMSKNHGVEIRFSVADDQGSPLTVRVIEKDPIAALAYFMLLKRNQRISFDPGLKGGGFEGVSWSETEATGKPGNFIPISVQDEILPGDILKKDRMR
jgi:hypothetical protein